MQNQITRKTHPLRQMHDQMVRRYKRRRAEQQRSEDSYMMLAVNQLGDMRG